MKLHELMGAHRYAEVATACEEGLRGSPDDEVLLAWHAHAMLCLGQLPEALAQYRRLDERERAPRFRSDSRIKDIGGILWMLGRPQEAIETFQATIDGILDHSITYADAAGGVEPGLLLWYAATSVGDARAKQKALTYLRNRAKRKAIRSWPGPLAMYVLETASEEDVLMQACGTSRLEAAVRVARQDMLKRRWLINATFCFATRSREQGSEDGCLRWMHKCAALENPNIEISWFLARAEVEQCAQPPPDPKEIDSHEEAAPRRRDLFAWSRSKKPGA